MTEVVSFKKEEGMYENCFSNFCEVSAYFSKKLFLEHSLFGKGRCDKNFVTPPLFILKMRILLSK
ncbi:hypothetical protein D355_02241 [Enterococcus faecium SD1C-2]|nr:hypothetical protein D355_02241 [Enterococcus faecium SD1C-2]